MAFNQINKSVLRKWGHVRFNKQNQRHGTQDPVPSREGMFALNTWKSNMFIEDDNRRLDMRRVLTEEWRAMGHSKWVGKHNGDGT